MKYLSFIAIIFFLIPLICTAEVPFKEITRDQILSAGPEWQKNYDGFQPARASIEALESNLGSGLKIEVYLGLWCPDSRNNVPLFLKILDQLEAPVSVRYFGVNRKPVKEIRYFVDKFRVEKVPTFIFFRGDSEIGRIVENPKIGLPEDMLAIISQPVQPSF